MSTTEEYVKRREDLIELPEYELDCLYDDSDDPGEVTIFFPSGRRTATEWVTADVETAVSIDDAV